MSSIDQQFVEYIVKSLVGRPDKVQIERRIDEKGVLLELTVDPEDLGRVIGKRGATAQSLRTLLRALGTKNDARYNLKIVDNGVAPEARSAGKDDASGSGWASKSDDDKPADEPATSADDTTATIDDLDLGDDDDEDDGESSASKTRKELEDLDDLDI